VQAIDGTRPEEPLFVTERDILDFAVSSVDGSLAVTLDGGTDGSPDIVRVAPAAGAEATPLASSRFDEGGAAISRDGRWLAYTSDESGRDEVYVSAFQDGSRRAAISITGGRSPRWNKAGDELFYVGADGQVMVAALDIGERVTVRTRDELFATQPFELGSEQATYDADASGDRLLVIVEAGGEQRPNRIVVLNVFEELRARGAR